MKKILLVGLPVAILLVGLGWGLGSMGERADSTRDAETGRSREESFSKGVSTARSTVPKNASERQTTFAVSEHDLTDARERAESNTQNPELPAHNSPAVADSAISENALVWELDPGVRVPAVFVEPDEALSPVVSAAFEQIAQDFEKSVGAAGGPGSEEAVDVSEDLWSGALDQADAQFRGLFGDANYNEQAMKGARDALPNSAAPASQNQ